MIQGWMTWFVIAWGLFMVGFMAIGGFFMFRKFLKRLPKHGGKSDYEIEVDHVDQTRHLWMQSEKDLLEELVSPVPEIFRDVARMKIAGKIGELALAEKAPAISEELLIRGYILATPKRDHRFLKKKLQEKNFDVNAYLQFFS